MKLHIAKVLLAIVVLIFGQAALADDRTRSASQPSESPSSALQNPEKLTANIEDRLASEERLSDANIRADVATDGAIRLRGTVQSMDHSMLAQQLAASVSGVYKIRNELQVSE